MKRRGFLGKGALALGGIILPQKLFSNHHGHFLLPTTPTDEDAVKDEAYWSSIRLLYEQPNDYINLENGYFSPMALPVIAAHQQFENHINKRTSWFMRKNQEDTIAEARKVLAQFLKCKTDELALTRNTTESLNTLIAGFPWKAGDEVVIGNQDYGSMVAAFQQAEKRHGIVVRVANVPIHPRSDEEIVDAYMGLTNSKTRLLHVTHLINLTGQLLPVAAISNAAHEKGILVAVDAAHSVAQINFTIEELGADFVGASLHKWMGNALGTGFLWMKTQHIPSIWPLMADSDYEATDIRKFEHQGTRPIQSLQTLKAAIQIHESIGTELKQNRLKYLMQLWCKEVAEFPGITVLTPWNNANRNSAIATVSVTTYRPVDLANKLLKDYNIFTVAIDHPVIKGVRVTPHLFTKPEDVLLLAKALQEIAKY